MGGVKGDGGDWRVGGGGGRGGGGGGVGGGGVSRRGGSEYGWIDSVGDNASPAEVPVGGVPGEATMMYPRPKWGRLKN